MPDSIWSEAIICRLSTDPFVAWAPATRPGTPQLPPCSHGAEAAGLEMALASTPPTSKKLPAVAAAPMRKMGISCALPGAARHMRPRTTTTAAAKPRPGRLFLESIVPPRETAIPEYNGSTRFAIPHRSANLMTKVILRALPQIPLWPGSSLAPRHDLDYHGSVAVEFAGSSAGDGGER